ncbi:MAG: DNA mismatch repair protein MutS [Bacteriovoracia bacterium]
MADLERLPNTPMWVQYAGVKKDALDALLFYRMGDFYELFLEDAVEASAILGITLTSRNKGEDPPIQMCGFPFHSATPYINRLLKAGKRVAICEQIENPAAAKGIVKREIVRVVSPGMAYDNDSLDGEQNNFLLVLKPLEEPNTGVYCQADLSTGSIEYAYYSNLDQLRDDLALIQPKEIIAPSGLVDTHSWNAFADAVGREYFLCVTPVPDFYFEGRGATEHLRRHFDVLNLEGFGLAGDDPAVAVVGATFRAIKDTQKQGNLCHLQAPRPKSRIGFVQMDESTMEHLDLFPKPGQNPADSVFHHLNRTCTAIGARKLREILARPLATLEAIVARQEAISELKEKSSLLSRIRTELSGMRDLERLIAKVGLRTAGPRDIQAFQQILARLPKLKSSLEDLARSPLLAATKSQLGDFHELNAYLELRLREELPAVSREGNIFRAGWHPALDELIQLTEDGKTLLASMEEQEREKTGINSLKIKYNRVFGYFIEVTTSNLANVPPHYIRKQTTANGERYLTEELKKFEEKALSAQEKRISLEEALFQEVLDRVASESQALLKTARELALLDALNALATSALEYGYEKPIMAEDASLEIESGRHPALEHIVGREKFIANSVSFSNKEKVFLITGPNMAGKSTYMRQVALITLLAHTGSFVPAKKAHIGLVDRIATRVGASDRIGRGQSTFMVEMNEMARILRQSTGKSLLIIDEIGRGTSTFDGLALAWSILEEIAEGLSCRTLFATHYHELTALEQRYSAVRNLCVAVEEQNGQIVFLHEVRRGKAPGSYGLEVARLAGLPAPVIERAKIILTGLEKTSGKSQKAQKEVLSQDVQLTFFSSQQASAVPAEVPAHLKKLESALHQLDLEKCTPFEALLKLKQFKDGLPAAGPAC